MPGQCQKCSEFTDKTRQEEGTANIGEKTNSGFRHCKNRPLGCHTEFTVHGKTDTATHGNAVNERNIGNFEIAYLQVNELKLRLIGYL